MSEITETVPPGGRDLLLLGIVTIILGCLAIAAPLITGLSIAVLVGVVVLVGGIARIVWGFRAGGPGKSLMSFALGGVTILCGVALVTDPVLASGFLTIILGLYLVLDGVLEIATAFVRRPTSGWGWLLVGGILSCVLGLLIWRQFPLSGAWAIGVLLGVKLLIVGILIIGVGRAAQASA